MSSIRLYGALTILLIGVFLTTPRLVAVGQDPAPQAKKEKSTIPEKSATFQIPLEKGTAVLIAGFNSNTLRVKDEERNGGVDPFKGFLVPDEPKVDKFTAKIEISSDSQKADSRWVIRVSYETDTFDASIPFEFSIGKDDENFGLEKIEVPVAIDGAKMYVIPYAKTSTGQVRSVVIAIAKNISDMKKFIKVTDYHMKFNWTSWFFTLGK